MTKRTKIVLVAGATALALAGIGGGVAFASGGSTPSTPSTSASTAPSSTAPAKKAHHPHRLLNRLGKVEHGEVTVSTKKGEQVVDVQRGQVTAVSPTSVTVRSGDGFTATYVVDSSSKFRADKKQAAVSSVHDGDQVAVVAVRGGGKATVRGLRDNGPK